MGDDDGAVDRTGWGPGPWDDEPDFWQGIDIPTGLVVFAKRGAMSGCWLGYACLPPGHPARARGEDWLRGRCVHGGVTWVALADAILHPVVANPPGDSLLVGFDCAHAGDYFPAIMARLRPLVGAASARRYSVWAGDVYRTLEYARVQLDVLCRQLGPSAPLETAVEQGCGGV